MEGAYMDYIEKRTKELETLVNNNDPDQLLALLKSWSFKPTYSIVNALLIYEQLKRPAIALGTRKYWESKGFAIKYGAKPITIWKPVKNPEDDNIIEGYLQKSRYDITQTTGKMPYMFNLNDALLSILKQLRISVKIDIRNPQFATDEYTQSGRAIILNPSKSNNILYDLAPIVVGKFIYDSHAKERATTAAAMLIYRSTGDDSVLRQLIASGEIRKATILTDRAAYSTVFNSLNTWFPGINQIPDNEIGNSPEISKDELNP